MKNILKILLSFFAFLLFTFAVIQPLNMAGNWYQQFLPNLNGRTIVDITFTDSLTGYGVTNNLSVADTGYILKTTNGGDNWFFAFTVNRGFTAIEFINITTGYACGGSGGGTTYLCKTTNAGLNWDLVNSPSAAKWDDMHVLSNDTIWLVEDDGLTGGVFRTTNGGANWTQQINLNSNNPEKIYMYNGRIGFFSSTAGLYKTTTSGVNWFNASNDFSFSDMFFIDSLTGWKASFFIKKTTNGGLNWINQPLPTGNFLGQGAVDFMNVDNDTIWAVGETILIGTSPPGRGILYRTTNGGNNWLFQIPDTAIHIFAYTYGQMINNKYGWAYSPATGIHTTTGGDTEWLTDIKQLSTEIPKHYSLFQNYPNPFNPKTIIRYDVKGETENIKLVVYNITGKELVTLVNTKQSVGTYAVDFDASTYSSGVYFYKLIVSGKEIFTETKKMMLIK